MDHLGVNHLGVDHLGVDHLGVDHLGVDHLGVDHLQTSRDKVLEQRDHHLKSKLNSCLAQIITWLP